jgi:peptidyl-prolyl cis-trans isomerase SurA
MRKKIILFCVLFLTSALFFPPAAFSGEVVDRIVAVVNDDIIRLAELNRAVAPLEAQIRAKNFSPVREQEEIYKIRLEVLNNLIDEKLADQEIRSAGIFVDEKEIDSAIEQVKAMNYYSDEDLRRALAASDVDMAEYREEIRRQILRNKLVNYRIKSKIIITESDIENYYNNHPEKYASKKKYFLRNILIADPDRSEQMQEIYQQLKNGMPFEEAARQYSEAANAADGGRLGFFSLDDLAAGIQAAVATLSAGEFSGITETDQGLQIFFLEKIEEQGGRSLDAMKDEIRQLLYEESVNKKFQTWIDELREAAYIKIIR